MVDRGSFWGWFRTRSESGFRCSSSRGRSKCSRVQNFVVCPSCVGRDFFIFQDGFFDIIVVILTISLDFWESFWVSNCFGFTSLYLPPSLWSRCLNGTVMIFGGVWWGFWVVLGEFDKIVANALRSKDGSKGRSLCNLRRYFWCQYRVLFAVGEVCLDYGSQILPKQSSFWRSCLYLW